MVYLCIFAKVVGAFGPLAAAVAFIFYGVFKF